MSKTYVLNNKVSPWDPLVSEARHTQVFRHVGTPYPLFIYCESRVLLQMIYLLWATGMVYDSQFLEI
jgi:hypothetical protein